MKAGHLDVSWAGSRRKMIALIDPVLRQGQQRFPVTVHGALATLPGDRKPGAENLLYTVPGAWLALAAPTRKF